MTTVRPLRLHDLPFAYRLAGTGISFDAQLSLTVGMDSLRQAFLAGTGKTQAYVYRQGNEGGLGQLHFLPGSPVARLAFLAPSLEQTTGDTLWLHLLDGLAVIAGERGIVTLVAEADEDRPDAIQTLRRSGFASYAHQTLWQRPPAPYSAPDIPLRPYTRADEPAIVSLYSSLVPGLIKHVEPLPLRADHCYILSGRRGIGGLVTLYEGTAGTLTEVYRAPDCPVSSQELLAATLRLADADSHQVFCRLRDYMNSSTIALENLGFAYISEQAVMYRHTAARIRQQSFSIKDKVEGGIPMPSTFATVKWDKV